MKKFFIVIYLLFCLFAKAQDIHFSSTGFNPMFFNPSMTGFMNSTFRVSTIYRNQWQTISKGYNTFLASFELQPWTNTDNSKGFGLGFLFTNDVAGELSFGQKDIGVNASYFFSLDRYNNSYLSFGGQVQRCSYSTDISKAHFNRDNLYNDNIRYQNRTILDLSIGVSYQNINKDNDNLLQMGVALFHINTPSFSYFDEKGDYLHRRLFANCQYTLHLPKNDKLAICPQIFYQRQHSFNEILAGSDIIINLEDAVFTQKILSCGLLLRNFDAIVVSSKFRFNNFVGGLSYDINFSKLSKASCTYGGLELWITYSFNIYYYKQQITKIPCPKF